MQLQAFQPWERRDENDNIIRAGSYGKKSALTNAQNTGILDYIGNNLDVLRNGFNDLGVDFDEQGHTIINPTVINKVTEAKNEALQAIENKGASYQQQITKNANDITSNKTEITKVKNNIVWFDTNGRLNIGGLQ